MIKNRRKKKREETERVYVLLCDGHVQFVDQAGMTGMVWSKSYDDAKRFASEMCNDEGGKVVVGEIGTVDGETVEGHLMASIESGANAAFGLKYVGDKAMLYPRRF